MRTRDKSINIRVTNGEKKRLEAKAKRYGMTVSTYLRMSGLDKNINCPICSRTMTPDFMRESKL